MAAQFMIDHEFIYCDDLDEAACGSRQPEKVSFFFDGSAGSSLSRLAGRWRALSDRVVVGDRVYRPADEDRFLYSPRIAGASFGTYIVLPANLEHVEKGIRAKHDDPARRREMLHYELSTGGDVLHACEGLVLVGDRSSIPLLLDQLPHRPGPRYPSGTAEACSRALQKISGGNPGITREDWEAWLTSHPNP
jgi:hypothetical protein